MMLRRYCSASPRDLSGGALLGLMLLGVALLASGCGSGSSNNQGVSFTLTGFFESSDDDAAGQVGVIEPLSFSSTEDATSDAGAIFTFVGLQNNLSQQFIRTDGVFMDYFIPGASKQPPSSATGLSTVIGPAVSSTAGGDPFQSTLPPSFAGEGAPGNISKAQVMIVPPDVLTWMNLNRAALPELPFLLVITVQVTGVTSSGDRLDSNEGEFLVEFTPDNRIPPQNNAPQGGDNPDAG